MDMTNRSFDARTALELVLTAVALAWVGAFFAGIPLPGFAGDRTAFVGLVLIGMTMCALGMRIDTYGWGNPFNIAGVGVGVLILLFVVAVLLGFSAPGVSGDASAILALLVLMDVKVVIAVVRGMKPDAAATEA